MAYYIDSLHILVVGEGCLIYILPLCSLTSRLSCLAAPSSSFFSRDSFALLSYVGTSQTSHRRRGARLIVRADSVSISFILVLDCGAFFGYFVGYKCILSYL